MMDNDNLSFNYYYFIFYHYPLTIGKIDNKLEYN